MNHENERVSDYVLGLLSSDEAARVADHLSTCISCRQQVRVERRLVADVKSTLDITSVFNGQKLESLMPLIPSSKKTTVFAFDPRQIALATALIVVILGGMILGIANRHGSWRNNNNSIVTATTVVTETPSFTATAASSRDDIQALSETSKTLYQIPALAAPIPRMTPESNGTS
jgi:hypothetical protein